MSAIAGSMHDHIETIRLRVPSSIHPAALTLINEWLGAAHNHVDCGDTHEAMRRLDLINDVIDQELRWQAENHATARNYRDARRSRHQADRFGTGCRRNDQS